MFVLNSCARPGGSRVSSPLHRPDSSRNTRILQMSPRRTPHPERIHQGRRVRGRYRPRPRSNPLVSCTSREGTHFGRTESCLHMSPGREALLGTGPDCGTETAASPRRSPARQRCFLMRLLWFQSRSCRRRLLLLVDRSPSWSLAARPCWTFLSDFRLSPFQRFRFRFREVGMPPGRTRLRATGLAPALALQRV